jgi:hypothetical protein
MHLRLSQCERRRSNQHDDELEKHKMLKKEMKILTLIAAGD